MMECLLEQGVDTVFGYPGGTILNLYDELYKYEDKIKHILTAHEQGAAHAADGYARSTGKTGGQHRYHHAHHQEQLLCARREQVGRYRA